MIERIRASWTALSQVKRHAVLISTLAVATAIVAGLVLVWQLHRDELAKAVRGTEVLASAVAEQGVRSMQGADLMLRDLRDKFEALRLTSPAEFRARLAGRDLYDILRSDSDFVPQVDAVSVVSADGRLVNFSRSWPAPPTNLADRDYAAFFRTVDTRDAFVSAPVRNRGDGRWTFYLALRVNAPDGTFLGMVLAALDLDYFGQFFRTLARPSQTAITLARRDGTVLASEPPFLKVGDHLPPEPDVPGLSEGAGTFEEAGPGGGRLVAMRVLPHYPLIVTVSITRDTALADWRRIALAMGGAGIGMLICFVLLVGDQLRQFDRLERSEALLAQRNADLTESEAALRDQAAELRDSRAALAERSATMREALRYMNQGLVMFSPADRMLVCNEHASRMLGLPPELVAAHPSYAAFAACKRAQGIDNAAGTVAATLSDARRGAELHELHRPDGIVLEVTTVSVPDGGLLLTYTDITARRIAEQRIGFMARHDQLTGLFNRSGFAERFESMVAAAAAARHTLAVYYLDLDGFKLVNDTYGHATGDTLLTEVAERLRSVIRDTDVVARLGGDEFAVVQPFTGMEANITDLSRRLLAAVAEPYEIAGQRCLVNLSIGVAVFPQHGGDTAALLHHADLALYRAKAEGKGTFRVFDGAVDGGPHAARSIEADLVGALGRGEFFLEYQPIRDAATLGIARYEALVRWAHPNRGTVPPNDFIPVAERTGLIVPLGAWVLEQACAAAAAWPRPLGVSVNLSPLQLARRELAAEVEAVLQRTGLDPARLHFEVTEGVRLEATPAALDGMARLRRAGVRFGLDDFGTAYAGLATLRTFSFDALKIDKSFILEAARTAEAREVLDGIKAIAAAFQLEVVAEGVETERELALARTLGCSFVQGYLLGRPSPVVEEAEADGPAVQGSGVQGSAAREPGA